MPIHLRENQYNGVNAHLHSLLQRENAWEGFHTSYIVNLTYAIDTVLPEGYYVLNELIFPSTETPFEEEYLQDGVIYVQTSTGMRPIVHIELLSPLTRSGGLYADLYAENCRQILANLIALIEIDFSPNSGSIKEVCAYPYQIVITDPRSSTEDCTTTIYRFGVDEMIPTLEIPLMDNHTISIDFNAAYQYTFVSNRYYGTILVDYEQLPVNFEAYSEADQQRIRERMKQVQAKE